MTLLCREFPAELQPFVFPSEAHPPGPVLQGPLEKTSWAPPSCARPTCENNPMKLHINGEERDFASNLTLSSLLDELGMKADRVAIELNRNIIAGDRWSQTALKE